MQEIRKYSGKEEVRLNSVKLNGNTRDGYSLDITYLVEDLDRVERYALPRVYLPINKYGFVIDSERIGFEDVVRADVGFGPTKLLRDDKGVCFTVKTIKEKTKEMTLEEIEKKLGHKVKIISEEEN